MDVCVANFSIFVYTVVTGIYVRCLIHSVFFAVVEKMHENLNTQSSVTQKLYRNFQQLKWTRYGRAANPFISCDGFRRERGRNVLQQPNIIHSDIHHLGLLVS